MVKLREWKFLHLFFSLLLSFVCSNSEFERISNETTVTDNLEINKFNLTDHLNNKTVNDSKTVNRTDHLSHDNLNATNEAVDLKTPSTIGPSTTDFSTSTLSASNASLSDSSSPHTSKPDSSKASTLPVPDILSKQIIDQNNFTTNSSNTTEMLNSMVRLASVNDINYDYGSNYFPEEDFKSEHKFPDGSNYKIAIARATKKAEKNIKGCRSLCREYLGKKDGECVKVKTRIVSPYCDNDSVCKCKDE